MIFCAKFYFSAQMATMAIGNANPDIYERCVANVVEIHRYSNRYEGPAKSFVTGFGLLQCYVLSNIFYYKPSKYSPFTETHFCNLLPSQEKQINSLLLVSVWGH